MKRSSLKVFSCLLVSLQLMACSTAGAPTQTASSTGLSDRQKAGVTANGSSAQSDNPSSTSYGKLTGKLILPGLLANQQLAAQPQFSLMAYWTGLPAHAQTADTTLDLTETDLQNLQATVNGETVDLTVTEVVSHPETEETEVAYEIAEVPDGVGNEVVEITTEDGMLVGGVITEVESGETTEQNIDSTTTSLLQTALEIHGRLKIGDLSTADIESLRLNPLLLNKQASLRSILRKDGSLKPNKAKQLQVKADDCGTDTFSTQSSNKDGSTGGKGKSTSAPGQLKKQAASSGQTNPEAEETPSNSPCTPQPSAEPSPEPSPEPSSQPSPTPSPELSTEPSPEPTASGEASPEPSNQQ